MTTRSWLITGAVYGLMSIVTLSMYAWDKRRAIRGGWRISESTLHWAELSGGWPGAWVGQRVFRHKWAKRQYMLVYWRIVGVHALGWGMVVWMKARGMV